MIRRANEYPSNYTDLDLLYLSIREEQRLFLYASLLAKECPAVHIFATSIPETSALVMDEMDG